MATWESNGHVTDDVTWPWRWRSWPQNVWCPVSQKRLEIPTWWQWSAYRKWIHVNPLLRRPCWYTNVGMAWLRHTCQHTASQRHHSVVGITCALLSPVNSLFHVRGQTTETTVLPFTGQSCGTVFQPISVCWTFHCQCSGNDWKFPFAAVDI